MIILEDGDEIAFIEINEGDYSDGDFMNNDLHHTLDFHFACNEIGVCVTECFIIKTYERLQHEKSKETMTNARS